MLGLPVGKGEMGDCGAIVLEGAGTASCADTLRLKSVAGLLSTLESLSLDPRFQNGRLSGPFSSTCGKNGLVVSYEDGLGALLLPPEFVRVKPRPFEAGRYFGSMGGRVSRS